MTHRRTGRAARPPPFLAQKKPDTRSGIQIGRNRRERLRRLQKQGAYAASSERSTNGRIPPCL